MKKCIYGLSFCAAIMIFSGCLDDDDFVSAEEQFAIDTDIIDQYLEDNSITAIEDPTGLRYVITQDGSGGFPELTDRVNVTYEGRLLADQSVFDSNDSIAFQLQNLILGWQIGIPKINEGGSATLYIQSGYAYGTRGQGSIPPNANLIFDITLNEIE
ncbi:MAG: FKBP-type peptidyl-prolyl cis-trans isomerase [Bacteroidota bacterium]